MKNSFLFIFLLLFMTAAGAYEVPAECKSGAQKDCVACGPDATKKPGDLKSLSHPLKVLSIYSYMETEMEKLSKVNNVLKKSLAPLFRTLRDGESEPSFKESRIQIAEIQKDFNQLTVLSRESLRLQRKFDICLTSCSPLRRLEIEDELRKIQRLKTAVFLKQPVLANKTFEDRLTKMDDKMIDGDSFYSRDLFERDLQQALYENLNKLDTRDSEYFKFKNDEKKPYRPEAHVSYVKEYTEEATDRYPALMEDLVKSAWHEGAFKNPSSKDHACYFAEKFKSWSERKEYKDMALDAGLFILPVFAGPIGRGGALGAELIFGQRLATWGIRSAGAQKALSGASLVFQAGTVVVDLERLKSLSEECRAGEVQFLNNSSAENLQSFQECRKKLSEKILMTEISLISAAATNISPLALKYFASQAPAAVMKPAVVQQQVKGTEEMAAKIYHSGMKLDKNQIGIEFKTPDSGVFSVMDLNAVSKVQDANVKKIPEEYWRYVGNIYNERLNLTKEEVEGFIKSSVEMSPRTKLILNTEKSPLEGSMKINGGVGIVHAQKSGELLPLEKATGVRIDRKPDEKIVEIVRLTVGKDVEAEKMSKALVGNAVSLITQDKSISRVFIFTSKIHARLYKRMGIPADKIKEIDKRDVLIEMTRPELERVMKEKTLLEKATSYFSKNYFPARLKISSMMANIWSGGRTPSILTPLMR